MNDKPNNYKVIEKLERGDAVHIDLKNQTARPTHFDKGDKWMDTALVSYEVGDEYDYVMNSGEQICIVKGEPSKMSTEMKINLTLPPINYTAFIGKCKDDIKQGDFVIYKPVKNAFKKKSYPYINVYKANIKDDTICPNDRAKEDFKKGTNYYPNYNFQIPIWDMDNCQWVDVSGINIFSDPKEYSRIFKY